MARVNGDILVHCTRQEPTGIFSGIALGKGQRRYLALAGSALGKGQRRYTA